MKSCRETGCTSWGCPYKLNDAPSDCWNRIQFEERQAKQRNERRRFVKKISWLTETDDGGFNISDKD